MARVSRRSEPDTPTYEDIARKAYELYTQRGGAPGRDVDDWLEAERLLVTVDVIDVIDVIDTIEVVDGPAHAAVAGNGTAPKPAARRARTTKPTAAKKEPAARRPRNSRSL
jgi:hypothetical protein